MQNKLASVTGPNLPNDNRSPRTRFFDDIQSLARMASITYLMVERAHSFTRATKKNGNIYTLQFSASTLDEINFAVSDVMDRAASLAVRGEALAEEDE